jgi:extradiol dioxygenase family protein
MDINPQYTFDMARNPIGVFLPMEEWKQLSEKLELDIPTWQKDKVLLEKKKTDKDPSLLEDWSSVKQQLSNQ